MSGNESSDLPARELENRSEREAFVRGTFAELFLWFRRHSGSQDRAADLTKDTIAAFWVSLDRIRGDVSLRTWIWFPTRAIASRICAESSEGDGFPIGSKSAYVGFGSRFLQEISGRSRSSLGSKRSRRFRIDVNPSVSYNSRLAG